MWQSDIFVAAKSNATRYRAFATLLSLFMVLLPVVVLARTQAVLIDETMPGTIPQDIISDWETQDQTASVGYKQAVTTIAGTLPSTYAQSINSEAQQLGSTAQNDPAWRALYLKACHYRRISRMKPYAEEIQNMVFTRHHNFGGPLVGFLEGIMGSRDTEWADSSALCLLKFENYYSRHTYMLEDKSGVIKDPVVSFDGTKILFAWSKRDNSRFSMGTGFKLYELDVATPQNYRQITTNPEGLTVSDIEPCYLPNGDIVFNSSRCFGMVDCAYNIVSNLYICNGEGKYLRRVGYDQVHTFYPVMMSDGKVLYTRWEYNDRLLTSAMGLFTMNPDGTHQIEYYGNQTNWPMTVIHGRQIPNTRKVIAVISGHHAPYSGELVIIDPNIARNGLSAVQLVAPPRQPPSNPGFGTDGGVKYLFQNPWPLDDENFIVSWRPTDEARSKFKLYFMNVDGTRELIAWDNQSVSQPVLLRPTPVPPMPAVTVDYTKTTGAFTMQDIYQGSGLLRGGFGFPGGGGGTATTVPRGTVKKLRVVALDYRINNAIGRTGTDGFTMTPVARWTGSWEAKRVLGETPVYEDGSAAFIVPARTPVFFQAIDSNGYVVQTMRSWATLQPGETFSCLGCHEDKNEAPAPGGVAMAGEPQPLQPFHGAENKGFNYHKFVQPIWDSHCVSCHKANHASGVDLRGDLVWSGSLNPSEWPDDTSARKNWSTSYLSLTKQQRKYVDWITIFSQVAPLRAYPSGASTSPLVTNILRGNHKGVSLSKAEMELVCCWIDLCIPHAGYYTDGMTAQDSASYENSMNNRRKHEALEERNIQEFIAAGQYGIIPSEMKKTSGKHSIAPDIRLYNVKFLPNERMFMLNVPGKGQFMLLDLTGRQVANIGIPELATGTTLSIPLPPSLGRGIYIAQFKTGNTIRQNLISVVR